MLTFVLALFVDLRRPALTWLVLIVLLAWNASVTWSRSWDVPVVRWLDIAASAGLLLVAPVLVQEGSLQTHPFFVAAYPMSTIATWAATRGLWPSMTVAIGLFVPLALSRPLNGLPYEELPAGEVISVASGLLYYGMASLTVGLLARTLDRAGADLRRANEDAARQRERVARMEEREALGREIHDSVLQAMALVHRRGLELTSRPQVPADEVRELLGILDAEERSLRSLLARGPDEVPSGAVPLRTALEAAAYGFTAARLTISITEPAWVPADSTQELTAAIRQALDNVAHHAHASTATLFGEHDGDVATVTVRDDGVGFEADEERLQNDGHFGISRSMRERIERLGGTMILTSAPARGTTVEFRIPAPRGGL